MNRWRNWSGHVRCTPAAVARPADEAALRTILADARAAGHSVRAVGSGHSFSPLCATDGMQISLDAMTGLTAVDADSGRVRVRAGTRLGALNAALAEHGLALENLGDIDVQTVSGALATGTHGTGAAFGSLATQITGMRLVRADGEALWLSAGENAEAFRTARVHLGALGVVTEVELTCVPAYNLRYRTFKADWDGTLTRLDAYRDAHRNFECYWFPYTDTVQIKLMDATDAPATGRGRWRGLQDLVVENGAFWALCQVARAWPASCPSLCRLAAAGVPAHDQVAAAHNIYATTRAVRFNETEYSVPIDALPDVLTEIRDVIERERFPVNFPLEVRFVAADDIPASPAYGRASAFVAAHMYAGMPFGDYFAALTEIFDRHDGRPHWGKWHDKTAAAFERLYPEWRRFAELRAAMDPEGLFLNDHLRRVFGI